MLIAKQASVSVAGGVLLGVALLALLDGVLVANQETQSANHFSFIMCVPAVFATAGFALSLLVSPAHVRDDHRNAKAVVFSAWLAMIGSTVSALAVTFFSYCGQQSRARAAPGVALVLHTTSMALSSALLWWSRGGNDDTTL